ncbi:hypothetical protein I307_03821 [Cryptococcus deuterogattii 99/473]|uniref:Uncharacterized protein n=1 Tax=Cryptococcus deuterogattii Ram5 TaxID=1296110 RepID=A0A0D0SXC8_9TREE|nr:hypothetical protein I352_02283 [Cryptococcus deuterogattii MMRL2647]KIR37837.1 hypothetical protein I313_06203 [Cryptococcus deuterogattii Ram5]KIR70160.1 hypothetical protein I310_06148 [Cryptococcus deuterogattii CA1014]KIS00111.1 hypothetical protein L804_02753 [Cryptococcus deuterogattii 2001/935-1]KIY56717.1 hypothetical protein I307_03821 [Cryptococcus deuterogattii 99/473]
MAAHSEQIKNNFLNNPYAQQVCNIVNGQVSALDAEFTDLNFPLPVYAYFNTHSLTGTPSSVSLSSRLRSPRPMVSSLLVSLMLPATRGAETLYFHFLRPMVGNVKSRSQASFGTTDPLAKDTGFNPAGTTAPSSFAHEKTL